MADAKNKVTIPNMKLYFYPKWCSLRCAWLIHELGIEHKVKFICPPMEEEPPALNRDKYRQTVHPHNTVPALQVEGGPTLLESGAICLYLADLCGKCCPPPQDRAEYYDWILYTAARLDQYQEVLAMQWWINPKGKHDPEAIAKARAETDLCLDRAERALTTRTFILGDQLTAADCVLGYDLLYAAFPEMNDGELLKNRPNIRAYVERIKARPALVKAMELKGE